MPDDEFMDSVMQYIKAEIEAVEKGEQEFTCPLCGGDAFWVRSPYTGHKYSGCRKCGMKVME